MGNMFRCTLASGGGALILTVTCDSDFAGQTITCTDGTTTLTQTCPSSSPYTVEFKIPNGGIWTVSSGTSSTTATIENTTELHIIPDGATATPTDDIQTWLHCANIWDKTYTTISQVLGDATTVTALVASNNAADYMARSTTWVSSVCANSSAMTKIGANDYCANILLANSTWRTAICNSTYFESVLNTKVPTMINNDAPSGHASAGHSLSQNYPYKAFDADSSTYWYTNQTNSTSWIQYEFTSEMCVYKFKAHVNIMNNSANYCPDSYTLKGSNDGVNFTNIKQGSISKVGTPFDLDINVNNATKYKYLRLFLTNANSGYGIGYWCTLQFYGRA